MRASLDVEQLKQLGPLAAFLVAAYGLNRGLSFYAASRVRTERRSNTKERKNQAVLNVENMRTSTVSSPGVVAAKKLLGDGIYDELAASTKDLMAALASQFSAGELVAAMQQRAADCTAETNCVVQFFDEAAENAKTVDSASVLKGFPVSIKECFGVAGYHSTIGLGKLCSDEGIALEDSVIVKALRAAGGVPFCHTNVPQTMMSYECSNPVYGTTTNPWDLSRGPGGSSGGEAALIAAGGSVLGIGSDIGGSCRIPAHFCGVVGFKPTGGRFSGRGSTSGTPGQSGVCGTAGLLSRDVHGCELLMKALLGPSSPLLMSKLDPLVPPLPWRDVGGNTKAKKVRIGYYKYDSMFRATPACERAVDVAVAALEGEGGYELVDMEARLGPLIKRSMLLFYSLISADQGETMCGWRLDNDDVDPVLQRTVALMTVPNYLRRFISSAVSFLPMLPEAMGGGEGWKTITDILKASGRLSVRQLWAMQATRDALRREMVDLWNKAGIEALLTPAHVIPAAPSRASAPITAVVSYTAAYNVLDFPAGVLPVTVQSEADERALQQYPVDEYMFAPHIKRCAEGAKGLPIGVQCVCLPWRDEECIALMAELERLVHFTGRRV